jgi:chorismate--pyruvate lyase
VRPASLRRARWVGHPEGTGAAPAMRDWLATPGSLTARLVAHSAQFRVQKLRQQPARCLADEAHAIGLPRARRVWEREVLLRCDGRPAVFSALGERSLGSTLFRDPLVVRGRLEFARLRPGHPLVTRLQGVVEGSPDPVYYARRCVYRRRQGLLLVTEVFLPAVLDLALANITMNDT